MKQNKHVSSYKCRAVMYVTSLYHINYNSFECAAYGLYNNYRLQPYSTNGSSFNINFFKQDAFINNVLEFLIISKLEWPIPEKASIEKLSYFVHSSIKLKAP